MFINNLQFWISSVLSLLININQETILDFLGIEGPFNTEDYSNSFGASQISTPVSLETFKLIIQSLPKITPLYSYHSCFQFLLF